jgi:hypothetical protein
MFQLLDLRSDLPEANGGWTSYSTVPQHPFSDLNTQGVGKRSQRGPVSFHTNLFSIERGGLIFTAGIHTSQHIRRFDAHPVVREPVTAAFSAVRAVLLVFSAPAVT